MLVLLISWSIPARAEFTSITVIGDSISDGGNHPTAVASAYKIYGLPDPSIGDNAISAQYFMGFRFSNSYVAVEHLANNFGLYDTAHFFNYAVGGFSTDDFPFAIYFLEKYHTFDPNGLFVIQVGGVDLINSLHSIEEITTRLADFTEDLYALGARHFLVVNSALIGTIPASRDASEADKVNRNALSLIYNNLLQEKMQELDFSEQITIYDLGGILEAGKQHASDYGITNTVDACIAIQCANPDEFLWIDDVHFTGVAHAAIGYSMYTVIAPKAPKTSDSSETEND